MRLLDRLRDAAARTIAAASSGHPRLWAWTALVTLAGSVVGLVVYLVRFADVVVLGVGLILNLAVLVAAAWWAFTTRRAWKRRLNLGVAGLVVLLLLADLVAFGVLHAAGVLALVVALAAYSLTTRMALGSADRAMPDDGSRRAVRPLRPWLLVNPGSGDGKAARIGLVDAARQRGIEVRVLSLGEEPAALARAAVATGADAVGVAGGDGSLGPVAAVAIHHDVPLVCVPVGTRNHFARDLGLDRGRPLAALDAFAGVERRVDIGTVGGQVFLNNVSLGAYADLVAEPGYRTGRLAAAHAVLPPALRGERAPLPISFADPDGRRYEDALVLLVANNRYRSRGALGVGVRDRLDEGVLQVSALRASRGAALAEVLARAISGGVDARARWLQWTDTGLRVDARMDTIPAGIDGEATVLEPPLDFRTLPGALRVLVPAAVARSPAVLVRPFTRQTVARLWTVAKGGRA